MCRRNKKTGTEAKRLSLSFRGMCCCVFECRAGGMFRRLSAYWQASDTNANCRSNLATCLFTLGIKLKNTASNFIPGFPHRHTQCDIYSLAWCPFSPPLRLNPSLSLLADNAPRGERGRWRDENDALLKQEWKSDFFFKCEFYFPFPSYCSLNYLPTARDKALFCRSCYCFHYRLNLH